MARGKIVSRESGKRDLAVLRSGASWARLLKGLMGQPSVHEVTQLLRAWTAGDEGVLERLTPLVWPHAPVQCGWTFSLDSTSLTNGNHTITIHATDTSNNEAILAPISVTVSN